MTKYITIIISNDLISYQIGKVCLVMPGGTHIRVSIVIYLPTSTRNPLSLLTFCLGLQVAELVGNIFLHQSLYILESYSNFSQ